MGFGIGLITSYYSEQTEGLAESREEFDRLTAENVESSDTGLGIEALYRWDLGTEFPLAVDLRGRYSLGVSSTDNNNPCSTADCTYDGMAHRFQLGGFIGPNFQLRSGYHFGAHVGLLMNARLNDPSPTERSNEKTYGGALETGLLWGWAPEWEVRLSGQLGVSDQSGVEGPDDRGTVQGGLSLNYLL